MSRRPPLLLMLALALPTPGIAGTIETPPFDVGFWCGNETLCGGRGRGWADGARNPASDDRLAAVVSVTGKRSLLVGSARAADGDVRIFTVMLGPDGREITDTRRVHPLAIRSIDDTFVESEGTLLVLATTGDNEKRAIRVNLDGSPVSNFGSGGVMTFSQSADRLGRGQIARLGARVAMIAGGSAADGTGAYVYAQIAQTATGTPGFTGQTVQSPSTGGPPEFAAAVVGPAGNLVAFGHIGGTTPRLIAYQPFVATTQEARASYAAAASEQSCAAVAAGGGGLLADAVSMGDGTALAVGGYLHGFLQFARMSAVYTLDPQSPGVLSLRCDTTGLGGFFSAVARSIPRPGEPQLHPVPLALAQDTLDEKGTVGKRLYPVAVSGDVPVLLPPGFAFGWPNSTGQLAAQSGFDRLVIDGFGRVYAGSSRQWSGTDWDFAVARFDSVDRIHVDGFE